MTRNLPRQRSSVVVGALPEDDGHGFTRCDVNRANDTASATRSSSNDPTQGRQLRNHAFQVFSIRLRNRPHNRLLQQNADGFAQNLGWALGAAKIIHPLKTEPYFVARPYDMLHELIV